MKKLQLLMLVVSISAIGTTQCIEQDMKKTVGRVFEVSVGGFLTAVIGAAIGSLRLIKVGSILAFPLTSLATFTSILAKRDLRQFLSDYKGVVKYPKTRMCLEATKMLAPTAGALAVSHLYTKYQNNKALIHEYLE